VQFEETHRHYSYDVNAFYIFRVKRQAENFYSSLGIMLAIETARLRLRPFTPADLDELAALLSDPTVMRYLGVEGGKTLTRAETKDVLARMVAGWQENGFGRWAVLRKTTAQLIGLCGFRLHESVPELLYLLGTTHWGQGFAAEAARASLRYGFEELRFERIVAFTRPENVASQRVLQKIGMRFDGAGQLHGVAALCYARTCAEFRPDDSFYLLQP
jgi:RimJ/RimL family protein N-acetyltransferase